MSYSIMISLSLFIALSCFLIGRRLMFRRHAGCKYPPGPVGLPLIGNIFDFPVERAAQVYVEWGKKYNSNILHATALGNHVVIINNREDADELFERRAAKYSDRPFSPITEVIGWEYNMAFLQHGEKWRLRRKICQQHFRQDAIPKDYQFVIKDKVRETLQGLLNTPEKFLYHNKKLSISIPMKIMYGYDVQSVEDPCISVADDSINRGAQLLVPGGTIINVIPFFRFIPAWFPGAASHKIARECKRLTEEMQDGPLEFVKSRMREGTAMPSIVQNLLEKKQTARASEEEENAIKDIAATVYAGASDTTKSATATFLYLMSVNPNVQRKAQEEIDRVVGQQRLPEFGDRSSMPYLEAIYREVLRWKPPGELAIPHSVSSDDYYKGYFIPKGTTVLGNVWAMTHDENVYPDPFTFNPSRFFDADGNFNEDNKPLAYGFGRRVCIGKHVSSSTLWFTFASILAVFDIGKSTDEYGREIEIEDDYEDVGFVNHKKPFKCSIKPRFITAQRLIEEDIISRM